MNLFMHRNTSLDAEVETVVEPLLLIVVSAELLFDIIDKINNEHLNVWSKRILKLFNLSMLKCTEITVG